MNLQGCGTALITPFKQDQSIDEQALRSLVEWQITSGIHFLVPCGTTGETPTLTKDEWLRVIDITIEVNGGRVPIVAGATSNCTAEAVEKARELNSRKGVDAILTASPYYNKPTQEGLFQHFTSIAVATKLPIVLYSIPGRCGIEIGVDTVKRLAAANKNIVGIKEAGGSADRVSQLRAALGPKFKILCGDDSLTLPFMAVGADGVVSVASNVIPREVSQMVNAFARGKISEAQKLHAKFYPLFKDLFIETNPVPVKAALALMGMMKEEYRLPLVAMSAKNKEVLRKTLRTVGVLKD